MNERITKIMNDCGFYIAKDNLEVTSKEIEFLCEQIVRECVEVCNSRVGNSDYNTGRMHCVSDLKEHFGVKE